MPLGSTPYIAFEWPDTTLADARYGPDMRSYAIVNAVLKTPLTSCIILANRQLANTDRIPDFKELASANMF